MKNESEEEIIRSLIYEEVNRKKLKNFQSTVKRRPMVRIMAFVTAAAACLLFVYFFTSGNELTNSRSEVLTAYYEFPTIQKSRSSASQVDVHFDKIKQGKYAEALHAIQEKPLSEQDHWMILHLAYQTENWESFDKAYAGYRFNDQKYEMESLWLKFLADCKKGASVSSLEALTKGLDEPYLSKARQVIEKL